MSQGELQQLRPGDVFAGRYAVVRLIRAGGMGAVYEVEDSATRRHRALKLMHPSLVQSAESRMRFQREVFIGAALETEHVVEVLDAGLDQQSQVPYLTMELLKGEELGDRLERVGRLGPDEVVSILTQVGRALDKAHGKGIVHRDLKPENIFLTFREDGTIKAKILDFGIAKLVEDGVRTNATQAAGTPLYMAPEQTDRQSHVSPATDVWALGLVTYRMLVGTSYWQGDSLQQLYRQILMDPITSPVQRAAQNGVQLPPSFDHWFARVVARNPQERFQQAGQCVAELAQAFGLSTSGNIYGQTPPPHAVSNATIVAQGFTPYPSPQITPSQLGAQGPLVTPMPHQTPFGTPVPGTAAMGGPMGTQLGGVQTGGAMIPMTPVPNNGPAPKKGNGALFAGIGVGVVAVVVVLAVVLTGGKDPVKDTTTATSDKDKKVDTNDKTKKQDDKDKKPPPLSEQIAALNDWKKVSSKNVELQQHEVTREEYGAYMKSVGKKAKKPLDGHDDLAGDKIKDPKLPVTWVTYEAAEAFCQAVGGRLPTADEWDAAVAGASKQKYPWGDDWPKAGSPDLGLLAVQRTGTPTPIEVASSSKDHGPYGHKDLAGNVQEWTSTDSKVGKILRGSHIGGNEEDFKTPGEKFTEASAPSNAVDIAKAAPTLGFRCAREAK